MKAIFIAYSEAYNEEVTDLIQAHGQRGFTRWESFGQGTVDGEPHLGNHAWPSENHAAITMVEDDKVQEIMEALKALDTANPKLGLRAYAWNVEMFF